MYRTHSTTEKNSAQNVSSAEVEKSWSRAISFFFSFCFMLLVSIIYSSWQMIRLIHSRCFALGLAHRIQKPARACPTAGSRMWFYSWSPVRTLEVLSSPIRIVGIPLKSSTACKYCNWLQAGGQKVQTRAILQTCDRYPPFLFFCFIPMLFFLPAALNSEPRWAPPWKLLQLHSEASSSCSQEQTPHHAQKHILFYLSSLPFQTGLGEGE